MNVERDVDPERLAFSFTGRIIVAAAFVLLGYCGLATFADHSTATMSGATALASTTVAAPGNAAGAAAQSNGLSNAPGAVDAQNDPRECDAAKGLTSSCVFE